MFRIALGPTSLSDSYTLEDGFKSSASGQGIATELAFGGTVGTGVVLGGGIFNHTLLNLSEDDISGDEYAVSMASLYAPFVDVYLNPKRGFHFQAAVGYLLYAIGEWTDAEGYTVDASSLGGFGLIAGIGYEWFVGDEWSLGLLGRFLFAKVSGDYGGTTDIPPVDVSTTLTSPSLLFTVTYH